MSANSHVDDISQRKVDHLDLCASSPVEATHKATLLDEVELLHDALPEIDAQAVDLSARVLGVDLKAPLLITGMTGGAERAGLINRQLAQVAQEFGLAMGLGSQRAMLRDRALAATYQVRDVAPDILLLGNIGAVQATQMATAELEDLVGTIGANALCVHLNPGQELIQPEGDRDFRGCLDAIGRMVDELNVPVIVKETGCGLAPRTLDRLKQAGVTWVDVAGAGGTTWIGVEARRAPAHQAGIGEVLWNWGVPTAASIAWAHQRDFKVIGSGGLRDGLDAARALALGADLAGMALPWLRAVHDEGIPGAQKLARQLVETLRAVCVLTGSASLRELRAAPRMLGPNLTRWLA